MCHVHHCFYSVCFRFCFKLITLPAEKESTLCQEIWQIRQRAELAEVKAVYAEKKLQELVGEQDLQRDAALREQSQMDKKRGMRT